VSVRHATTADLTAWISPTLTLPSTQEQERLLDRASELIDSLVTAPYMAGTDGTPADSGIAQTLADATCAQVELWLTMGEDMDIESWGPGSYSAGGVSVASPPDRLAPRAARILNAGMMTGGGVAI
jgi:hypothetical protein